MGYERYFDHILALISELKEQEADAIHTAADIVADTKRL